MIFNVDLVSIILESQNSEALNINEVAFFKESIKMRSLLAKYPPKSKANRVNKGVKIKLVLSKFKFIQNILILSFFHKF